MRGSTCSDGGVRLHLGHEPHRVTVSQLRLVGGRTCLHLECAVKSKGHPVVSGKELDEVYPYTQRWVEESRWGDMRLRPSSPDSMLSILGNQSVPV